MPVEDDGGDFNSGYYSSTIDIKTVSDYSGLDFEKTLKLDCLTYRILLRDAIIFNYNKTESGREYLDKCWKSKRIEPDYAGLRKQFGRKG